MNPSHRDEIVGEIHRLQKLLDELQKRRTAPPADAPAEEGARGEVLAQARLDEAYAQLEIAKRIPTADAWQAIQKATSAVGSLGKADGGRAAPASYNGPLIRLTLFVSVSGPSLRAVTTVHDVVKRLGDRVSVEVCDVSRDPGRAERAGVVFTPVLRLERAGLDAVTIFGALDDRERLLHRLVQAGLPLDADGAAPHPSSEIPAAPAEGADPLSAVEPTADTD
jgi:hypothetical protein